MKKWIKFLESIEDLTFKKIRQTLQGFKFGNQIFVIIVLLFLCFSIINIYHWVCENMQELCDSNSEAWYCVCNNPSIAEQLAELENSQQAAPWKVTLDHNQIGSEVKIVPKIELKQNYNLNQVYLSLFKINLSTPISHEMIDLSNQNKLIDVSNDNIQYYWNYSLDVGENIFKAIITPSPIDWKSIINKKNVEIIDSLEMRVKFWATDDPLIINR